MKKGESHLKEELRLKDEELARLRRQLDAARERYFDLYDLAPAGIFTLDEGGAIIETNLTLARMLGLEKDDLLRRPFADLVHPDDRARFAGHCGEASDQRVPPPVDLRVRGVGGEHFWARLESRLGNDLEGRLLRRGVLFDVSERVRAQEDLRRLRVAVDQAHDGLAFADMEGRILFVNATWAREHGYSKKDLIGKPLSVFHTPEQLEREVRPFNKKVLELGSWTGEVGHVHRNGSVFVRWMSTVLLHDDDDKVMGFLGMTVDLSERQALLQAVPDVVYRLDADMRLSEWNQALERISGYSSEEIRGRSALDFFKSDRSAAESGIRETVETGRTFRQARLLTRSGEEIPFSWSGCAVRAADGRLAGLVGVGRDLRGLPPSPEDGGRTPRP